MARYAIELNSKHTSKTPVETKIPIYKRTKTLQSKRQSSKCLGVCGLLNLQLHLHMKTSFVKKYGLLVQVDVVNTTLGMGKLKEYNFNIY